MLPPQHRLRSTALFTETVKKGRKKGSRTVVVYVAPVLGIAERVPGELGERSGAGPRVGLIVSKGVGNAVTRHAVSRRLRAAAADVVMPDRVTPLAPLDLPLGCCIVIRALPASASSSMEELRRDVQSCIRRALNA